MTWLSLLFKTLVWNNIIVACPNFHITAEMELFFFFFFFSFFFFFFFFLFHFLAFTDENLMIENGSSCLAPQSLAVKND